MKKIIEFFKQYKLMFITAISIIVVGVIAIVIYSNKTEPKEYITFRNDKYNFKYDAHWKIKEENEELIVLNSKNDSTVSIYFKRLNDEYKYLELKDFIDNLLYDIESQNEDYKLLARDNNVLSKQNYDGYKFLFENDDSQVMVSIIKSSDLLTMFVYESSNEYFDILLDSAQNIVYSFENYDEKLTLTHKIEIDTDNIKWNKNEEVTRNIKKSSDYEIANKNYLVKYSIPENFINYDFDSTRNQFNYEKLQNGDISLNAYVRNINLYEYLDKENTSGLYHSYKHNREDIKNYNNFEEKFQKLENDQYELYIYKNSYTYTGFGQSEYEEVVLIYELDSNHIFTIHIEARNCDIPKELIDKIKLIEFKNYSSNVKRNIKDGFLSAEFKKYADYKKEKITKISLRVPESYYEVDDGSNMYLERNYGLNYNEDKLLYDYEVEYRLQGDLDSALKSLENYIKSYSSRENYKPITYVNDINLNGKTFKLYEAGYSDYTGAMFSSENREKFYKEIKILVYQFNGKCFTINIEGNGKKILDVMLKDLVDFNVIEE